MKKIIIIGAGSVGGHIANNLQLYGIQGRLAGFLDDNPEKQGKEVFGYPVLGPVSWILDRSDFDVVIGIAFPAIKERIVKKLAVNPALHFPNLIASNAWMSDNIEIGRGNIIYPGCCVNYGSSIKDFVVINMNCAIGHDCTISSYCSLAPGVNLGGFTTLQSSAEMCIGSSTIQGAKIGKNTVIGGQGMVIKDLPDNVTAVGVPTEILVPEFIAHVHSQVG